MNPKQRDAQVHLSLIIYPISLWSIIVMLVLIITLIELKQMTIVEKLEASLTDNNNMTEFIRDQTRVRDKQMRDLMKKVDELDQVHENPANASEQQRR